MQCCQVTQWMLRISCAVELNLATSCRLEKNVFFSHFMFVFFFKYAFYHYHRSDDNDCGSSWLWQVLTSPCYIRRDADTGGKSSLEQVCII